MAQQSQIAKRNLAPRARKLKPFGEKAHRFAFRRPAEDRRITILEGAVRSSKTWAMIMKILVLCKYEVQGQRLVTGASKGTIKANVLDDLFEIVGEKNYDYNQQSGELRLFETWWRVIGGKDEGSEKFLRGSTVGVAVSDELTLMPKSFVFMLLSRLSPEGARWYATTNPDSPYHYVKSDIIENPDLKDYLEVIHLGLEDNPNLTDDYKEFIRRSYTGVWYQRFVLGLWVMAEGAIYRDVLTEDTYYDDATRPVGLLSRGGHVERWIPLDYGTTNALAAIDIYDDGDTVWADREHYYDSRAEGRQKTDSEYADDLIRFIGGGDPRTWPGIIIDPSAASFRAELLNRGLYVIDADNEVVDGIRRVSTMLGRKKLRINRQGCPNGVREMQTYSWNEKKSETGNEQPVKKYDHWPDACRYYVKTRIGDWRLAA
jgi:PBSX family phage terminase large subunit